MNTRPKLIAASCIDFKDISNYLFRPTPPIGLIWSPYSHLFIQPYSDVSYSEFTVLIYYEHKSIFLWNFEKDNLENAS